MRAPNAQIAFDPFHVVKLANEAVHDVRRTEARIRPGSTEAEVLKRSRWSLLKAPENLLPLEKVKLAAVAALNARVFRSYLRCSPTTMTRAARNPPSPPPLQPTRSTG
ncbi:MAG: hypothetical protein EXR73_13110 [Myxococcales bacterium]|nr:hypothetical protein [Myxococcales bacterium]